MRRHLFNPLDGTNCIIDSDFCHGVYAPRWEYIDDEPAPTASSPSQKYRQFTEAEMREIGDEVIARLADARAKGKSLGNLE